MYINFFSVQACISIHFLRSCRLCCFGCCSMSESELASVWSWNLQQKGRKAKCAHMYTCAYPLAEFCNLQQEKDVAQRWHYYAATTSSGDFCPLAIVSYAFPERAKTKAPSSRSSTSAESLQMLQCTACSYQRHLATVNNIQRDSTLFAVFRQSLLYVSIGLILNI